MTAETTMFWVVWSPQGRLPVVRHPTAKRATEEAKRLARSLGDQTFFVLKAIESFESAEPVHTPLQPPPEPDPDDDDMPF